MYQRHQVAELVRRLSENSIWTMQLVVGPRQTGKSTMIAQALDLYDAAFHSVSADDVASPNAAWIERERQ